MQHNMKALLRGIYHRLNPRYAARRRRIRKLDNQAVFSDIYEKQHWGTRDSSVSGYGSTHEATRMIAARLPELMKQFEVSVLLDAPCGDFTWMKDVPLGVDRYIGGDIVPALIQDVRDAYAQAGREFIVLNLLEDELPACDMLFCRDCMLHLAYRDQKKLLENLKRSEFKYVMLSTFPKAEYNRDIVTGEARQINLLVQPICLPEPILSVPDNSPKEPNRAMGVWSREQIDSWIWGG